MESKISIFEMSNILFNNLHFTYTFMYTSSELFGYKDR